VNILSTCPYFNGSAASTRLQRHGIIIVFSPSARERQRRENCTKVPQIVEYHEYSESLEKLGAIQTRQRNRPLEKKAAGRRALKEAAADAVAAAALTEECDVMTGVCSKNAWGLANVENPWRCLCLGSRLHMIVSGMSLE
jgi:hypothetical protein